MPDQNLASSVFAWRANSWFRNIWTSAFAALVIIQIVWLVFDLGFQFETADEVLRDYLWYVYVPLFIALLIARAPVVGNRPEKTSRADTDGDA